MLQTELGYLHRDFVTSIGSMNPAAFIDRTTQTFYEWCYERTGLIDYINSTSQLTTTNRFQRIAHQLISDFKAYVIATLYSTQVFIVRVAIIALSWPAFVLFFFIGAVDGLTERDLRRWGGGRESSTVFQLARNAMFKPVIVSWVVYLSMPVSIHPTLVITPLAVLTGVASRVTFERYKKYF
jgi:integrating conjugative element membrane protein (TIGR03747 family)